MPVFCLSTLGRHGNFTAGVTMEQPDLLITFKSYTNKRTENTCPGFPPLKNTILPRFRVSNVNIFFKTVYQIKAFILI
jgi:hypothetical protein